MFYMPHVVREKVRCAWVELKISTEALTFPKGPSPKTLYGPWPRSEPARDTRSEWYDSEIGWSNAYCLQ